ncbi:hypothetical protein N781_13135 [Pontibacillus halophilus JSM 076056 = DSM 19796]|uniref:Spore coat protein n=1 Tax=Pontibacillus halophilus JSM 076056 = DSM 19796 TaxID=1385510 RepID=A0A0A5GNT7_9BACI|nr:hypothetical protein [Pontibacillus halophilus]KGX92835.1 hypothetical protein N781_13135 [Pontibacillus halophilus JSM 076056 = DSM 19796]
MQQQQQPTTKGNFMPEPPSMVSQKDQLYLVDMLSWNLNAAKKAHHFANLCTTPDIKATIEQVGQMHQRHYETILSHLNDKAAPSQQPPLN